MIKEFVERYEKRQEELRAIFSAKHPEDYSEIVRAVVTILHDPEVYGSIDPKRITEINHGYYQGTLVYVLGGGGYQPSDYWWVMVSYGSCSGCDTLEAIRGYQDTPTAEQVKDYMLLALHILQGIHKMEWE